MKQISKAEFIHRVTENKTIFIGISPSGNESQLVKERLKEHSITPRYAVCKSNNHLVFGVELPTEPFINDSHLYLADVKPHTFYKCYEDDGILIVDQEYHDQYSPHEHKVTHKYLYYKEVIKMDIKLFDANTKERFENIVSKCKAEGYVWATDFPNHEPSFEEMKGRIHGNAKLLIHCFHNSITNKMEMECTTLSIMKSYPQYKNISRREVK